MSPPCLELQGCHLIPLYDLFYCSSAYFHCTLSSLSLSLCHCQLVCYHISSRLWRLHTHEWTQRVSCLPSRDRRAEAQVSGFHVLHTPVAATETWVSCFTVARLLCLSISTSCCEGCFWVNDLMLHNPASFVRVTVWLCTTGFRPRPFALFCLPVSGCFIPLLPLISWMGVPIRK